MHVGILGSSGFVGRNLADVFTQEKIKFIGGSRRSGVDGTNLHSILDWIERNKITHLVNLAAECGGIGLNAKRSADLWRSTTQISNAVLEATRITKLDKLIMVGTVCSYAQDCPTPFKEDYLMHYGLPESTNMAYGVAKLNALIGAQAYAKQFGIQVCNFVPVNMYGPNDNFDLNTSHVIPALIAKIDTAIRKNTKSVNIWGTGRATREFLYVQDFADAVVLALNSSCCKISKGIPINIGINSETSIKDLTKTIADLMGFTGSFCWDAAKPDGQPRRKLDVSRAKELLKFEAKTTLKEGLKKTIEWYRQGTLLNF